MQRYEVEAIFEQKKEPIIATFLSLSKFICLSVSIRIVIQKWHITVSI